MENQRLIFILLNAVTVFCAGLAFTQPLRKRTQWMLWMPVCFLFCLASSFLSFRLTGPWLIAGNVVQYVSLVFLVERFTRMSLEGNCYCAVWASVTSEAIYEIFLCLTLPFPQIQSTPLTIAAAYLSLAALVLLLLNRTLAKTMPQKDIYQIGPRQLLSALVLGGAFSVLNCFLRATDVLRSNLLLVLLVCQLYCVSLQYLQTELFKKSQMRQDMNALNLLYSREKQQYETVRQNMEMVNRKCEELDRMIEKMQQYLSPELLHDIESTMDDAMRACDTVVKSGNSVLDTVLSEKKLLAEAKQIPISCVADGKLLDFMEVVDIYALFSNALDNAIEAAAKLPPSQRMIDVLVHESQNFVVINISNPLKDTLEFEEDLPVTTKRKGSHGYGLKVLRRAIEKYHGVFTVDTSDGMFTLRILIPLPKK